MVQEEHQLWPNTTANLSRFNKRLNEDIRRRRRRISKEARVNRVSILGHALGQWRSLQNYFSPCGE